MKEVCKNGPDQSDFVAVTEALDSLNKELHDLERHFKEQTAQMPRYDVEKTQKSVSEVRTQYLQLQDQLQPKKKFGFKNRAKAAPKATPTTSSVPQEPVPAIAKGKLPAQEYVCT